MKVTTRLKAERYGEVLTTKEDMERLEKAGKGEKEHKKQERKRIKLEKSQGEQMKNKRKFQ